MFEYIECLHYQWKREMPDYVRSQAEEVEEVDLPEYEDMLTQEQVLYGSDPEEEEEEGDVEM